MPKAAQGQFGARGDLTASCNDLYTQFEYADDPDTVVIDLTASHIWDASTVASLDAITTKYERKGKAVTIVGLDGASAERHGRLTGQLQAHRASTSAHGGPSCPPGASHNNAAP